MKGGGQKTVTQQIDPQMQKFRDEAVNRARSIADQGYVPYNGPGVAGVNSLSNAAANGLPRIMGQFGDIRDFLSGNLSGNLDPYAKAGQTGANALGGDPNAISKLMNPYTSQVIDRLGGEYDKLRSGAALDANDAATRAGALGGSRHDLLVGTRLGEIDRAQGDATANLLNSGYSDMMSRAASAAGLGANTQLAGGQQRLGQAGLLGDLANSQANLLGQQFNMGDYMRQIQQQQNDYQHNQFNDARDWGLRGFNVFNSAVSGMPYGQTQSEPLQRNGFAGAAGGALTGAKIGSFIPGLGTAAGGIIGGLGGLLFG